MSDQAVLLPKWFSHGGIILAKGQLDHSYTFWTMSILIFSPVYLLLRHPLCTLTGTYCNSVLDKIYRILKKGQRIFMVACLTLFLVKLLNTKKNIRWKKYICHQASKSSWHIMKRKKLLSHTFDSGTSFDMIIK